MATWTECLDSLTKCVFLAVETVVSRVEFWLFSGIKRCVMAIASGVAMPLGYAHPVFPCLLVLMDHIFDAAGN